MSDYSLESIVVRAQHGDHRAFDCLVRRYQGMAVAYARTLLHDPVAAEDAAQEAFVRAWSDLPRLINPVAFGGWLRRIVFKYCDRARRTTRLAQPLSDSIPAPYEEEPFSRLEQVDQSIRIHAALSTLPCAQREATLLYYLAGQSVIDIAAFLEVPPSTIKNRLYSARKRLRKELWEMAQNTLGSEKPSHCEEVAAAVLARVLREFQRQESIDRHTADRTLLDQARKALFKAARTGEDIDEATVRDGFIVLWRKRDWTAASALLMRYLGQPISDSEVAWAYLHLANVLAESGSPAGAVLAHEAFERSLSGKALRLSTAWPYYPVSGDSSESSWVGDDVRLLFLFQATSIAYAYLKIWRRNEYLAKVDTVLSNITPTANNRHPRFFVRRMATAACIEAHDYDRAQVYVRQMYLLTDEGENEEERAEIRLKALGHDMQLARLRNDDALYIQRVQEASALLEGLSNEKYKERGMSVPAWVKGQRHDLAHHLLAGDRHEMALPLLEANLASGGQLGGWGWLMHAAAVWQVTHDRDRTQYLLRKARDHDDRDMAEMFAEQKEFASVWKDREFLTAVSRSTA